MVQRFNGLTVKTVSMHSIFKPEIRYLAWSMGMIVNVRIILGLSIFHLKLDFNMPDHERSVTATSYNVPYTLTDAIVIRHLYTTFKLIGTVYILPAIPPIHVFIDH